MALQFNRKFDARAGEPVSIAQGVRRVTAPNAGPFTFAGTNTFLVGDDQLLVIDPGPDDGAHVEALLRAIGNADVAAILVTHTHRDHSPGARLLQRRRQAPIHAAGVHTPSRPPRAGEQALLDASGDLDFTPDRLLADGDIVEAGPYRLETVLTPGHSANHAAFALLDRNTLFSGDHVMGWSTTIVAPPDGSMAAYMASLDKLLARPEQLYLPAHGPAIPHPHDYVSALREHRLAREAAILDTLRSNASRIPELVERIYPGLAPELRPAAALSVFAHLEDLAERGIVSADSEPTLGGLYRVTDAVAVASV